MIHTRTISTMGSTRSPTWRPMIPSQANPTGISSSTGKPMRRRMALYPLLALLFLLGFTGCSASEGESGSTADARLTTFSPASGLELTVSNYAAPTRDGCDYDVFGLDDAFLYFAEKQAIPGGNDSSQTNLIAVDRSSGQQTVLLPIQQGSPHWVNEETMAGDALFWCITDGEGTRIEKFTLASKSREVIAEYPGERATILLCADDRYVSWIRWDASMAGQLWIYDCETQETRVISDSLLADSPYTRVTILNGICAFRESEGSSTYLCIYDLNQDSCIHRISIDMDRASNIMANSEFVIWNDGGYSGFGLDIYKYTFSTAVTEQINSSDDEYGVFSYALLGHYRLLLDNGAERIVCKDLLQNTLDEQVCTGSHVSGRVLNNNAFLAARIRGGSLDLIEPSTT